jgi:hypothetical protein
MALTITKAQRDALYDQILDRLSGIGDIEMEIRTEKYEAAKRLASDYSDDLRLLDDLGFGDGEGGQVELSTPPEVLRRALPRLQQLAQNYSAGLESELVEVQEIRERNRLISEACETVLSGLDGSASGAR